MQIDPQDLKSLKTLLEAKEDHEKILNFFNEYIYKEKPKCDICKKEKKLGEYEGKMICQDCWAETLTDEDIMNL